LARVPKGFAMRVLPVPVIARRLAVLLVSVATLDAAVALMVPHPAVWCACVASLMTLLAPLTIFGFDKARR
jgi:hypothetical protein